MIGYQAPRNLATRIRMAWQNHSHQKCLAPLRPRGRVKRLANCERKEKRSYRKGDGQRRSRGRTKGSRTRVDLLKLQASARRTPGSSAPSVSPAAADLFVVTAAEPAANANSKWY
jgi:hypothetical protein